jgi:RNA-directed DNA polymerase
MHEHGKSDRPTVLGKPSNKDAGAPASAEGVEGEGLAAGKTRRFPRVRTQSRRALQEGLERIRQASKTRKEERLTALWPHVYNPNRLHEAYLALNRESAPGVDGVTWEQYGQELWVNLTDLAERLQRGAYRPPPVERTYIPKRDGSLRPIGKPTLEDKIVQRAVAEVLGAVYETEFLGFSYGFRPGRNPHNALDALSVGLTEKKINWVLDADIRGFFDAMSHEWIERFLQHRIADPQVIRQIQRWLRAGVVEKGEKAQSEEGTPQGGSISPLLANLYLHYAFDLWVHRWRRRHARGEVIVVRYADDFVVGFSRRDEAEQFLEELKERLQGFNLELHASKTRLIEFGRRAAPNRAKRGVGKPETFNFLGFTHMCSTDRKGRYIVRRHTMRQRLTAKLQQIRQELRERLHAGVAVTGEWLRSVLKGHYQYYGVPRNSRALGHLRDQVMRIWCWMLRRRSQKHKVTWARMVRLAKRWLPQPRITHPYPDQRLCVITRGRSPVR